MLPILKSLRGRLCRRLSARLMKKTYLRNHHKSDHHNSRSQWRGLLEDATRLRSANSECLYTQAS